MPRYNSCLQMAKACPHANVLGDCQAKKKMCDEETPFILNDNYSNEKDDNNEV